MVVVSNIFRYEINPFYSAPQMAPPLSQPTHFNLTGATHPNQAPVDRFYEMVQCYVTGSVRILGYGARTV